MTQRQKQKSARKSSPSPSDVDPNFLTVYDRDTCQSCGEPISKRRLGNCKKRRFFPVCVKCEKIITPKLIEAKEKMAEIQKGFK